MRTFTALLALPLLAACHANRCCPPRAPQPCPAPRAAPAPPPAPVAGIPRRSTWELRILPKAQRWALVQKELALSDGQMARMREAVALRDRELEDKAFIVTRLLERLPATTAMGDADEMTSHIYADALAAADAALYERARAILSPQQFDSWEHAGFAAVFGRQLPILPPPPGPVYDL